jgi:RNA polymerase sigma factor (sigma-70 family)
MARTAVIQQTWDVAATASRSQQWVLDAMQTHGPALVTMLWRILGREQDVCDAYQETFLQLAYVCEGLKPANAKAYIFRTASNVAISMLRRRRIEARASQVLAQREPAPPAAHAPGEDFDTELLCRLLREHIAELPEMMRNVIVLHDLGELPYEQVARDLEISVASARVYRFKAVQLLAAWMGDKS